MEFLVGGAGCWSLGWRFMGGMVVRACVDFQGDWRKLYLSFSLRWWVQRCRCVYSRELEEGVECTCLCCQVHGEETRSLSVCRGCSLICFFNLALMIGRIQLSAPPAGRYAIILYTCTSPAIQMHVSKCLSLLFDVATRRITFGTIATRNKNATHLLASASEKKIEVGLQSDR